MAIVCRGRDISVATSLVVAPATSEQAPDADPFQYGWRYVRHDLPDGNYTVDQVPLTLEDVLHPEEGDQVPQSTAHQRRCRYLCDVLEARLAHDASAVVLHDVRIKWDVPELRPHGPDIMVIFGVREAKNWSTFDVAAEGTRPVLIIEVTSPETRAIDLVTKLDQYDLAGVAYYVIVDAVERRGRQVVRLLGYRQTETAYTAVALDERGWLWLEPVQLWLGVVDNEVYCFDEHGVQIGHYAEVVQALSEAELRADAATQALSEAELRAEAVGQALSEAELRAETAEARVRDLEAELRRLRGAQILNE